MLFPRSTLGLGLFVLALTASAQTGASKSYIVELADAPAVTYTGTVAGLAATRPTPGAKLDANAPSVRTYLSFLNLQQSRVLASVGNAPVLHRYSIAFNGFSAQLTEAQVAALRSSARVRSVTETQLRKLDTTRTSAFLGLSTPGGLWSQLDSGSKPVKGEDVIIGVIDSGVWPENASFGDKVDALGAPVAYTQAGTQAYAAPPAKWVGVCQTSGDFTSAMCNNKLIGARYYRAGFDAGGGTLSPMEYSSPRDGGGHGTHTASTAGGNANATASIDGVGAGAISGMAPRARIAAYKVCWEATVAAYTGCYTNDTLKAIDDAVKDGVDVINFSVSGTQTNFVDPVEIAYLNATAAGVFVAASAGNSGPANQVAHMSPWLTTVAASTHDRYTVAPVTLGSGVSFSGPSYQQTGTPVIALIRSIDAGVLPYASLTPAEKTALERCYLLADGGTANTALDPVKAGGKMVICYRGGNVLVNKAAKVKAAGGVAMLIQNVPTSANTTVLQPYTIPTVHLTNASYAAIDSYVVALGAAATASFGPAVQQAGVVAPVMAGFSSRGPNKANGNILKPDITGPGVDIIAAYLDSSLTQAQHDLLLSGGFTPQANSAALQGTSMSSPHIAGVAALFKQLYPAWSPAAIKSALMTTATDVKLASGATDPDRWGYGAGHVNPNGAANPGLVYDTSPVDFGRFLCGLGLAPPAGMGPCLTVGAIQPWNLNQAGLTASDVPGTLTFTRRVTNTANSTNTYVASTSLPGWTVLVSPASLTLAPGASASFSVTVTSASAVVGAWSFGSLVWSDGTHQVRSPLSVRGVAFVAPAQVSDTRVSGRGTKVYSITSNYTGSLSLLATGLVPATLSLGSVIQSGQQCFAVPVAAGAQFARFQLFNADTLGGSTTDLDLDVYTSGGSLVGSSGAGGSDEVVTLNAPAADTYRACVYGYATPGGGAASFTLSSWVVGPAVGPQTLRASGPSTVYTGGSASVGLAWSVLAGQRYMGHVQYRDSASAVLGSTIVFVDNH